MITVCLIIFAAILCHLIYNFNIDSQDQKQFDDMAQTISIEDNTDENADNDNGITDLINKNSDCIGWVRISGTKIDYTDCFEQSETDEDLRNAVFSAFAVQINADEFNNLMSVIKNTVIDIDLTDTDKNNLDLVKWAEFAYNNHWGYVWGSHGQVLTEKELNRLKGVFGTHVTDKEAYIREHWLGRRTADCVGLIKGYGWYNEESGTIKYGTNGMKDVTADGMFSAATEKGTIGTMPDIPGLAVWHKGHIGVYIGNGYVIHAANTYAGVIKTPITSSGWTFGIDTMISFFKHLLFFNLFFITSYMFTLIFISYSKFYNCKYNNYEKIVSKLHSSKRSKGYFEKLINYSSA